MIYNIYSQLIRDYGDKEAKVIQNTVGNIFSGEVVGETAKSLSERFGKVLQKRQSISINRNDTATSISTQLDSLIPASKISTLIQGMFVGNWSVLKMILIYSIWCKKKELETDIILKCLFKINSDNTIKSIEKAEICMISKSNACRKWLTF